MIELFSSALRTALVYLEWGILAYFLLVNSFYLVLLLCAAWEMRQHLLKIWLEGRWRVLGSRVAPGISILVPAYNEAATIGQSLRALLALYYPNLEVVVINDGSQDETLAVLEREFELVRIYNIFQRQLMTKPVRALYRSRTHPNLIVADKENGGKADSLNAGLNLATRELVCAIDADTLIEPDALQRMVRPFLLGKDVLAAGGTIRVVNASIVRAGRVVETRVPRQPLTGFQVLEYLRSFLFGRLGLNPLGGNLIISGAFGLFRRPSLIAIGGYRHETIGEDMEIVVRMRRHAYEMGGPQRVDFIPDPVAWTEVPQTLRNLARQRDRWHRGLAEVMWGHRRLFFNPRYGAMGLIVYPYFFFVELLSPVVEALGLLGLGVGLILQAVDLYFAALFFLVAYGYGQLIDLFTMVLEEIGYHRYEGVVDRVVLGVWALFENFGYRQLTIIWRLRGLIRFLAGRKEWGVMERTGFVQASELPSDQGQKSRK